MRRFQRFYADSARARQLLSNAFERMEKPGYVKTEAQRAEIIGAAKELNIAPDVASKAYDAAAPPPAPGAKPAAAPEMTPAQRQRAAQQADVEMFGPPKTEQYESSEFQYDDLPALAHLHLEEHRAARELIRSAAYELPLLAQYRSAYRPPTSEEALRFTHYAFVGEPEHRANSKVVLAFSPESSGLPRERLHALKLLAGKRFDSAKNEIRISANVFGTQAQNKAYLAQIYSKLVAAAAEGDDFADVPLNQRHVLKRERKRRAQLAWPEEWNRPDLAPRKKDDIYHALAGGQ